MLMQITELFRTGGFLGRWFLLLLFLLLLLLLFLGFLLHKKRPLHHICFFAVLGLGLLYSLVLPPFSSPDEIVHFMNAWELSGKMLGEPSPLRDEEGRLLIRAEDEFFHTWPEKGAPEGKSVFGTHMRRAVYEELHRRGLRAAGEEGYVYTLQNPIRTIPTAHLFPALGVTAARALKLGGFGLAYFGRFMNLLLFSLLSACAVRRSPVGKEIFLGVSLFPMVLEQAASFSYDAYVIGLGFCLTAELLALSLESGFLRGRELAGVFLLAVLLSPCKMLYSALLLGCFLIPPRRFGSRARYLSVAFLMAAAVTVSVVLVNFGELFRYVELGGEQLNEVSWAEGEALRTYDLFSLLSTPGRLFGILLRSLQLLGGEYLETMAGRWLGFVDRGLGMPVPGILYLYGAVLLLAITGRPDRRLGLKRRLWLLIVPLFVVFLTMLMMLVAYTPEGSGHVLGVQGRYFLPALPMLLLSLHGLLPERCRRGSGKIARLLRSGRQQPALLFGELLLNAWLLPAMFLVITGRAE